MSEPYGIVYRITNLVNGKCYHGQTVNPKERWSHHLRGDSHCVVLRNAIRKYGRKNFSFEVVAEAANKEELDLLEVQYVVTSLCPVGYNIREGGANGRPSLEMRRKMSLSGKEAQNRPEVRARNSAGVKRAWATLGAKENWRAAQKVAQNRPEVREHKRLSMLEVHSRPGESERRGSKIKEVWAGYSDEERQARIEALRAALITDEHRQKMSVVAKEMLARPEVKAKLVAAQKASFTPERRSKQRETTGEIWNRPGERERRGQAISAAHNTPEGKRKLAMRRRRGETFEAWSQRIFDLKQQEIGMAAR